MVRALASESSDRYPRLSHGRRHCVVFLGKTLFSHISIQVFNGTVELNAGGNPAMD